MVHLQLSVVVLAALLRGATPASHRLPTAGGPCLAAKPFCHASGLDVISYPNDFAGYSRLGGPPSSYYITQNLKPLQRGHTNATVFPENTDPPPSFQRVFPRPDIPDGYYVIGWTRETNGNVVVDANNYTVVYEGFYRAPTTGKYTFCASADNETDFFFGHDNAFSCLTGHADPAAKPVMMSTGGDLTLPNGVIRNDMNCTDLNLVQGGFYPVRNVMGNWHGPSGFNLTIQKPGESFEQRKNVFDGDVYPRSCGFFF
ncbi:Uncharacterized protein TCAP_06863 [Tolypocladium capitatum]|uniref:PA14 domain-containing protein n=1 Tax=Tolypocladium capitatum TaxID=45235 RepID=A0A2K3Q6P6_9HYPO|nr:Uncharacterized protein TCAP_06863 [Tolypocladium capitatum]